METVYVLEGRRVCEKTGEVGAATIWWVRAFCRAGVFPGGLAVSYLLVQGNVNAYEKLSTTALRSM